MSKIKNQPKWSLKLLRLFLKKDYLEEIEGDMEEVFDQNLAQYSIKKSRRLYNREVLKLLRPALVRGLGGNHQLNYIGMLQHNFLITLRGFKRHKATFLINLIGLSTGLAASLLIFLWVNDERSVDTFNEKNDRLYWVMTNFTLPESVLTWDYTSGKLAQTIKDEFPEVEDAVRVGNHFFRPQGMISHNEKNFEVNGLFASSNFFQVMTYPLITGKAESVMQDKNSVAISESLAITVFGNVEKAVGNTIEWENSFLNQTFIVTGVFKDPPKNATEQFNIVANYQALVDVDEWAEDWKGGYARTYLLLKEGVDAEILNKKVSGLMHEKTDNNKQNLFIQPYAKNYLFGKYDNGIQVGGRIENVRLFTTIAIFILLIACINFTNLSTAQASKKMKEVGVKKAIGAKRRDLVFQFLGESILLALFALIVAIGLVALLLSQFNEITAKALELDLITYILPLSAIVLTTGILAGSYPAFYLSGFKPVAVLKGKITNLRGEEWVRKGLVVVQFTLSIVFIIGVIIINKQIEFTQEKPLGYNRENIVSFNLKGPDNIDTSPLLEELKNIPGITSVSNMAGDFLWGNDNSSGYSWQEGEEDDNHLFKSPKFGYNLIETLQIELVAGRSFSKAMNDDESKIMLNETAVKFMGLENPIGFQLEASPNDFKEVIGVVRDFQYGSMHQEIEPMLLRFRNSGEDILIKLQAGTEVNTLQKIEAVYDKFNPKYNFDPSFLDDDYRALYSTEDKVAQLSNYMAAVAILISCLGLLGLAAFTAERKSKEIGIRKILGASQMVVVRLLTATFTKTVLISIFISIPIGYYFANEWLHNFAYAIELKWWFFALAGASAMLIAWFTIGFQTLKSARINPVDCLKNE
jgi:ABC-type antimicrobial peptide transport system permease subunit